jgi:hypothetical protein
MIFRVEKASQLIAFFARERGGVLNVIEASKLAYLADRTFMDRYGMAILGDNFVQMAQGPVCSRTYDLMKGALLPQTKKIWGKYMEERQGNSLKLAREISDDELDEFSDSELEVMYEVAAKFADLKNFDLVNWVHKNCPEWENPGATSWNLDSEEIFEGLKKENSEELGSRFRHFARLANSLKKMG